MTKFARMVAPHNRKMKKDEPTLFGALSADKIKVMHELRNKLVSPPIVLLPDAGGCYSLETDACNVQVKCELLQEQNDGTKKPVGI